MLLHTHGHGRASLPRLPTAFIKYLEKRRRRRSICALPSSLRYLSPRVVMTIFRTFECSIYLVSNTINNESGCENSLSKVELFQGQSASLFTCLTFNAMAIRIFYFRSHSQDSEHSTHKPSHKAVLILTGPPPSCLCLRSIMRAGAAAVLIG